MENKIFQMGILFVLSVSLCLILGTVDGVRRIYPKINPVYARWSDDMNVEYIGANGSQSLPKSQVQREDSIPPSEENILGENDGEFLETNLILDKIVTTKRKGGYRFNGVFPRVKRASKTCTTATATTDCAKTEKCEADPNNPTKFSCVSGGPTKSCTTATTAKDCGKTENCEADPTDSTKFFCVAKTSCTVKTANKDCTTTEKCEADSTGKTFFCVEDNGDQTEAPEIIIATTKEPTPVLPWIGQQVWATLEVDGKECWNKSKMASVITSGATVESKKLLLEENGCKLEWGLECANVTTATTPPQFRQACRCMLNLGPNPAVYPNPNDTDHGRHTQCYIPAGKGYASECFDDGPFTPGYPYPFGDGAGSGPDPPVLIDLQDGVYNEKAETYVGWNSVYPRCAPHSECREGSTYIGKRCQCWKNSTKNRPEGLCIYSDATTPDFALHIFSSLMFFWTLSHLTYASEITKEKCLS